MSRKSAEALLTPAASQPALRLEPLDTMSERQAAVWRAVVAMLPADYFSSAQVRQLSAYCSAVCVREDVERELAAELERKRPRRDVIRELRHDLKGWIETENRLARSMRLTHQAVYHREAAHTVHTKGKAQPLDALDALNAGTFEDAEA